MEKLFTQQKSRKQLKGGEVNYPAEKNTFDHFSESSDYPHEPSQDSLAFIMNYSKALSVSKTNTLGDFFALLN
jgi:hypothetical protein